MANTVIQVKRSTTTAQPSGGSLSAGEIAYSYSSNVFFVGSSGGNDVLAIGGKYYVEKTNSAYNIAVAAFDAANSGLVVTSAFDKANSANYLAYLASTNASAAFAQANNVGGAVTTANNIATAAFDTANAVGGAVTTANNIAIAAFTKANSAQDIAVAAYVNANTKLATTGGTITGDLAITGSLTLSGNTIFANVQTLSITDPLLYLAANNYVSDIVDIGFIANYVNATGSNVHTGLFREHSNKQYYLFQGYDQEPLNNHIDPTGNNFSLAVLNADLITSNLTLGGVNTITWITSSFAQANAVAGAVTTANNTAIAAFTQANNVGGAVTTANNTAIAAFTQANNVGGAVTTANLIATSAFAAANAASAQAANATFITSGTLVVARGGTGVTSFTTNGVLYGNTTGALKVTAAGTEGQVLQASSTGVPSFAMLDGGSF